MSTSTQLRYENSDVFKARAYINWTVGQVCALHNNISIPELLLHDFSSGECIKIIYYLFFGPAYTQLQFMFF